MTDSTTQNSDQNNTTPWFSDAHKDFVASKGWKSGDDAIQGYINAEKLIGAEKAGRTLVLPKDDNDADGIRSFRSKLGVPESASGYKTPDTLKDDPLWSQATAAAHKHGIPAKAFDSFMQDVMAAATAQTEKADTEAKATSERTLGEIKAKYGDKYEAKVALGQRLVEKLWPGATQADIDARTVRLEKIEKAFGTADMMELFILLGEKVGEPAPGGNENRGGNNAASAQQKIDELRARRLKNEISEKDYLSELEKLGPVAQPGVRVG